MFKTLTIHKGTTTFDLWWWWNRIISSVRDIQSNPIHPLICSLRCDIRLRRHYYYYSVFIIQVHKLWQSAVEHADNLSTDHSRLLGECLQHGRCQYFHHHPYHHHCHPHQLPPHHQCQQVRWLYAMQTKETAETKTKGVKRNAQCNAWQCISIHTCSANKYKKQTLHCSTVQNSQNLEDECGRNLKGPVHCVTIFQIFFQLFSFARSS